VPSPLNRILHRLAEGRLGLAGSFTAVTLACGYDGPPGVDSAGRRVQGSGSLRAVGGGLGGASAGGRWPSAAP